MDLDQDGRQDLVSGSWPGEIFWFRRQTDNSFSAPLAVTDRAGEPLNVGAASAAFVTDWQRDGDWDLIIGTIDGLIRLVINQSSGPELDLTDPIVLELPDREDKHDAAPIVVDWDGDDRDDLIVGASDGSVFWYRNLGTIAAPKFSQGACLVPASPLGWGDDNSRNPGEWGLRTKLCAADWNGDGKLDLLMGDMCGGFQAKPSQLASERRQELNALQELPSLRRDWATTFKRYRSVSAVRERTQESAQQLRSLLGELNTLKVNIADAQQIMCKFEPQRQSHGFVWLLLRR